MKKETWRNVKGYEGLYEVSSRGEVRGLDRIITRGGFPFFVKGVTLTPQNFSGYLGVHLHDTNGCQKKMYVHRAVAITFIKNPDKRKEVNHKNGKKQDNRRENLEWVSRSENQRHAAKTGLQKSRRGVSSKGTGLKPEDIPIIRELHASGMSCKKIAIKLTVGYATIHGVINGVRWTGY